MVNIQQLKSAQIRDDGQWLLNLLKHVPDGDEQLFCILPKEFIKHWRNHEEA